MKDGPHPRYSTWREGLHTLCFLISISVVKVFLFNGVDVIPVILGKQRHWVSCLSVGSHSPTLNAVSHDAITLGDSIVSRECSQNRTIFITTPKSRLYSREKAGDNLCRNTLALPSGCDWLHTNGKMTQNPGIPGSVVRTTATMCWAALSRWLSHGTKVGSGKSQRFGPSELLVCQRAH